jgi:hypothetical protein
MNKRLGSFDQLIKRLFCVRAACIIRAAIN